MEKALVVGHDEGAGRREQPKILRRLSAKKGRTLKSSRLFDLTEHIGAFATFVEFDNASHVFF